MWHALPLSRGHAQSRYASKVPVAQKHCVVATAETCSTAMIDVQPCPTALSRAPLTISVFCVCAATQIADLAHKHHMGQERIKVIVKDKFRSLRKVS